MKQIICRDGIITLGEENATMVKSKFKDLKLKSCLEILQFLSHKNHDRKTKNTPEKISEYINPDAAIKR